MLLSESKTINYSVEVPVLHIREAAIPNRQPCFQPVQGAKPQLLAELSRALDGVLEPLAVLPKVLPQVPCLFEASEDSPDIEVCGPEPFG
jgi:hypothetical protein